MLERMQMFKKRSATIAAIQVKKPLVFGASLPEESSEIPEFVLAAIDFLERTALEEEGLFRIPGDNSMMKRLREEINQGSAVDWQALQYEQHTVASLLKMYFRELPEPVLTYEQYDMWIAANGVPEALHRLNRIKKCINFLPPANKELLHRLCRFLHMVKSRSSLNKMNSSNLAIVFAPNLLRPATTDLFEMTRDSQHSLQVMQSLIDEYEFFFEQGPEVLKDAPQFLGVLHADIPADNGVTSDVASASTSYNDVDGQSSPLSPGGSKKSPAPRPPPRKRPSQADLLLNLEESPATPVSPASPSSPVEPVAPSKPAPPAPMATATAAAAAVPTPAKPRPPPPSRSPNASAPGAPSARPEISAPKSVTIATQSSSPAPSTHVISAPKAAAATAAAISVERKPVAASSPSPVAAAPTPALSSYSQTLPRNFSPSQAKVPPPVPTKGQGYYNRAVKPLPGTSGRVSKMMSRFETSGPSSTGSPSSTSSSSSPSPSPTSGSVASPNVAIVSSPSPTTPPPLPLRTNRRPLHGTTFVGGSSPPQLSSSPLKRHMSDSQIASHTSTVAIVEAQPGVAATVSPAAASSKLPPPPMAARKSANAPL